MIRALTLTSLFPNSARPTHGVFVLQRLQHLVGSQDVAIRVVAPVPWYPRHVPGPSEYTQYKALPDTESIGPFTVSHPKYVVLPKVGMSLAPSLMGVSLLAMLREIVASEPPFDLIDAHYFYPDGVAAAWLAARLGLPLVITARGTDVNLIPSYSIPRRQILWAGEKASAIIAVCDALRDEMIAMGLPAAKITTLRNGFDPAMFHPVKREQARTELGIADKTLLSVGHLIERKGHHLVIEALARLPEFKLIIIGAGGMEAQLKATVQTLALGDRVRFEGPVEQSRLKMYYSACDALVLASSREGMANVLIESIACGCPLVATDSWGTPEVIKCPEAGVLVAERSAAALEHGIRKLFSQLPNREDTLRYAEQFHWGPTSKGQFDLFSKIVDRARARPVN